MSIDALKAAQYNESGELSAEDTPGRSERKDDNKKKEIGGREGPDPTRFGDWEKNGRCIDF
jgi:hypothetical protein